MYKSILNAQIRRQVATLLVLSVLLWPVIVLAQPDAALSNPYRSDWKCTAHQNKWICREVTMPGAGLYAKDISSLQKHAILVHALGWIADVSDSPDNRLICGGHYYQPPIPSSIKALAESPTQLVSGTPSYQIGGDLKLTDGVVVTQPGRRLYAEQATISPDKATGKLHQISASGNIRLQQPGQLFLGSKLYADLTSHQAKLEDVNYLVRINITDQGQPQFGAQSGIGDTPSDSPIPRNFTGYAHGHADKITQHNAHLYTLNHASYSTCPPTSNAWKLGASKITLNTLSGTGTAYNALLQFHGVPLVYLPYFNFPINNERKTGFLYGSLSYSNSYGYYFSTPFYLNLASNYDDLITPQYYTRRGWMIGNTFRLLTSRSLINAELQYVPRDKQLGKARYAYFLDDTTQLPWEFHLAANYNHISDNNYLRDFNNQSFHYIGDTTAAPYSQSGAALASTALIPNNINLSRDSLHWHFNTKVQTYQVISQLNTENKPYDQLPAIDLLGKYPNLLNPFSFSTQLNYTNFHKSGRLTQPSNLSINGLPPEGQRAFGQANISMPIQKIYGFLTPTVSLNSANYQLSNTRQNQITRVLPILDVHSGLFFDRDFSVDKQHYSQTFEPQIFYLYVPYDNQNNIPVFDTTLKQFSFSQLFATNRFSGEDRIGDANQVSLALSSVVNNPQGQQVLSAHIGQIYYFKHRRVSLCDSSTNSNCIANEQPNFRSPMSDITSMLRYQITSIWNINSNFNYNPNRHTVDYQTYQLQYLPNPRHIFNLGYQMNRYDYGLLSTQQLLDGVAPPSISQFNTSFLWAISPMWNAIGSLNYSINSHRVFSEFGGLEYDSCCWAVRVVVDHYLSATNPNTPSEVNGPGTTGVLLEFELKGLGKMGQSQIKSLLSTIPGYNPQYSDF